MTEDYKNNLGGSVPHQITDSPQELVLTIPEELKGNELNIVYAASWISNLKVNDSNNTVTGTVSANTGSARSTTITLTASGNLSTTSPSSFVVSQSAYVDPIKTFKFTSFFHLDFTTKKSVVSVRTSDGVVGTNLTINGTYDYRVTSSSPIAKGNFSVTIRKGESEALYTTQDVFGYLGSDITSISPSSYGNERYTF